MTIDPSSPTLSQVLVLFGAPRSDDREPQHPQGKALLGGDPRDRRGRAHKRTRSATCWLSAERRRDPTSHSVRRRPDGPGRGGTEEIPLSAKRVIGRKMAVQITKKLEDVGQEEFEGLASKGARTISDGALSQEEMRLPPQRASTEVPAPKQASAGGGRQGSALSPQEARPSRRYSNPR